MEQGDSKLVQEQPLKVNSPRVTVVMLTFNRPQLIGRAIQSVIEQTLQDWELIVVQDGNHELTAKILKDWQERDPRIIHIHREKPGNIANACNCALERARGVYIAILDDDDYWASPEKLAKQVEFLNDHPDYVACGGGVTVVDQHGNPQMSYFKPEQDADIKKRALYANPLAHSSAMFRKSVAEKVGMYEESLAGFQDWDLWLKLGMAGKLYNFREIFLCYTLWQGSGSFWQQKHNTRSSIRIVKRHRREYKSGVAALMMSYAYHAYAHLPTPVKATTYSALSRLKKWIFSERG